MWRAAESIAGPFLTYLWCGGSWRPSGGHPREGYGGIQGPGACSSREGGGTVKERGGVGSEGRERLGGAQGTGACSSSSEGREGLGGIQGAGVRTKGAGADSDKGGQ